MPAAKTTTKKTVPKASRKVQPEDVLAILEDIAKMYKESAREAKQAQREFEKRAEEARLESEKRAEEARLESEKRAEEARRESEKRAEEARRESEKRAEEARRESEKRAEEARRESERVRQESEKARKESEQRLDQAMGRLGNKLGDIAEYTLIPNLTEKFKPHNLSFDRTNQNVQLDDKKHGLYAQIDALLENGSYAMVVEVKVTLRPADVEDHIRRMEKIRKYADLHNDSRQFYGAMAAMVVDQDVRLYALRQGFYVIEPSGEDVKITAPDFKPKFW